MDVVAALERLERLGGIGGRRELRVLVTRGELDRALEAGRVVRPSVNLYALPAADEAAVAARRLHGVVSHLSAALAWGWKVKVPPRQACVTVARNRHPPPDPAVDVHFAHLPSSDIVDRRTSPVRTVLDCARTLPFDEALAVADSALRSGRVTRAGLEAAARAGPRTGRPAALRVAAAATPGAANPFESVLRAIALGVPGLDVVAHCPVGRWHSDVGDPDLLIAAEAESFEFHALPEAFRHDIRRYTDMTRRGWLVARFVWEDVMTRPAYVHAVLAELVRLRRMEAVRQRSRGPTGPVA